MGRKVNKRGANIRKGRVSPRLSRKSPVLRVNNGGRHSVASRWNTNWSISEKEPLGGSSGSKKNYEAAADDLGESLIVCIMPKFSLPEKTFT